MRLVLATAALVPPLIVVAASLAATQDVRGAATRPPTWLPAAAPRSLPTATPEPQVVELAPTAEIIGRPDAVPSPITRREPALVRVELETVEVRAAVAEGRAYAFMTFDGTVPGPFIRVRVGDTVELHLKNAAESRFHHSIDLHAVTGPGGGAVVTQTLPGGESTLRFQALNPGIYVYHCATAPVPMHVASGMYGLMLVEPEEGLPLVDREFYVMQGEIYGTGPATALNYDNEKAVAGRPDLITMNGRVGALTGGNALRANVGERIRIYSGVGGFLPSSFHVIGEIFDLVYTEGSIGSEPRRNIQTTFVPAGGAVIVEMTLEVPGRYLLVDHALPRVFSLGAVGYLEVEGPEAQEIFSGTGGAGSDH